MVAGAAETDSTTDSVAVVEVATPDSSALESGADSTSVQPIADVIYKKWRRGSHGQLQYRRWNETKQEWVESCDKQRIESAQKALVQRIKGEAKDIHDKYIDPPNTTEFAIMFLPFEGLYSEVVNMGLVEVLQREYKVNIAGPSTMAALLNSLQMGFKTLAVQKRSAEVWKILGGVKTEFDKFNDVLVMTQQRLDQANKELDKLVGVRTRQIQRQLKDVESVPLSEQNLFE